jgi:hypothetical protein
LVVITLSPDIGVTLFAVLLPAFSASRVTPLEAHRWRRAISPASQSSRDQRTR